MFIKSIVFDSKASTKLAVMVGIVFMALLFRNTGLYPIVFGDEFTGRSIQQVIETVDRINRRDDAGNRLVRIHGVGFPVQFANPPQYQDTGIKFAILMRQLCAENDGTFVALNRFR